MCSCNFTCSTDRHHNFPKLHWLLPHNCFGEQCFVLPCGHFAANQPQQVSCLQLITYNKLIPKTWLLLTRTEFDETSMVTSEKQPSRNKIIQHSPNSFHSNSKFQIHLQLEQDHINTISNLTLSQRAYPVHQHHRDGAAHQNLHQNGCRYPHHSETFTKLIPETLTSNSSLEQPRIPKLHDGMRHILSIPVCMSFACKGAKGYSTQLPKPRDHCVVDLT